MPLSTPARPPGTVIEDYVKSIFAHTEWQTEPVTTTGLAVRLALAPSTVTEMVKKLAVAGLVTHVPYGAVQLTQEGRALAVKMVRRHRLIETWLVESHGYSWDEVHDEAEVLEHAISDRLLDSIDAQLGHPTHDPHGDPIPTADGQMPAASAVQLTAVTDGAAGVVARVSDRDPELLRYLAAERLVVGEPVTVIGRAPFGGPLSLDVAGTRRDLGTEAAEAIWIELDD